jgi:hypothetical protein
VTDASHDLRSSGCRRDGSPRVEGGEAPVVRCNRRASILSGSRRRRSV